LKTTQNYIDANSHSSLVVVITTFRVSEAL
jgi:hypothetical protein